MKAIESVAGFIFVLVFLGLIFQDCDKIDKKITDIIKQSDQRENIKEQVAKYYIEEIEQLRKKCEWANKEWKKSKWRFDGEKGAECFVCYWDVKEKYPNLSTAEKTTIQRYILLDGSELYTQFTIDNVTVQSLKGGEYHAFPPNRCSYVFPDYYYRVNANGKITRIKE